MESQVFLVREKQRRITHRRECKRRGRDCSDEATNQGTPAATRNC